MFDGDAGLWALFVSAFISSTLLPGGSEILLGVLVSQSEHSPWLLLLVASVGNTLGGITSWLLGWLIAKRYPAQGLVKAQHQAALQRLQKWGVVALLFSWVPMIGDPLCVAAGWLRFNFLWSCALIALGKTLRYGVVILALL